MMYDGVAGSYSTHILEGICQGVQCAMYDFKECHVMFLLYLCGFTCFTHGDFIVVVCVWPSQGEETHLIKLKSETSLILRRTAFEARH